MNPNTEKYRNKRKNATHTKIDTIPPEVNAIRLSLNAPPKEIQIKLDSTSSSENNVKPLISAPPEDDRPKRDPNEALRLLNEEMRQRGIITQDEFQGPRRGVSHQPY